MKLRMLEGTKLVRLTWPDPTMEDSVMELIQPVSKLRPAGVHRINRQDVMVTHHDLYVDDDEVQP